MFSLMQVFKPRPDWALLRRKLVTLDILLASSSLWAAAELLAGWSARLPLLLLGILVLLLMPLPCYFGAVNRRPGALAVRNALFLGIAAGFIAVALGWIRV